MSERGFKLNTKSAIGDIRKYSKETQRLLRKEMENKAWELSTHQEKYLYKKVKAVPPVLTNFLGTSIGVDMKGDTWEVGPNTERVEYAWYIEAGAAASQKARGNNFAGYWYVRNTWRAFNKKKFKAKLLKIIDRKVL